MRRAAFVLALVIGLMGVMVLPVQAHLGSGDSRADSRRELSNDDGASSRGDSARADVAVRNDIDDTNNNNNTDNDNDRVRGHRFKKVIRLSGANEVPAGDPDGSGWAKIRMRPDEGTFCYTIQVRNLDEVVAAHIHVGAAGVNGGVVIDLAILTADSKSKGSATFYRHCVEGISVDLLNSIKENKSEYYLNVHTTAFPDGAIRGQLGKVESS